MHMKDNMDYGRRSVNSTFIITFVAIMGVIFITALSFFLSYNSLFDAKEDVNLAQANVQTMMQRRLELIPDLVETTKAAAEHEEKVYESIANARNALNASIQSGDALAMDEANKQLTAAIDNYLNVVVEDYPEITASEQYTSLMDQLEGSVNRITVARENYNTAVSNYNRKVGRFPSAFVAGMFGFEEIQPFTADIEASNTNMVNFD